MWYLKCGLLGSDERIEWELTDQNLALKTPTTAPYAKAVVFKIHMQQTGLSEN
ncbi:hypothetical protein LQ318_10360 [Aliifodinibius salicampi]|uniref:Uncharacterized protein n=1 Tax=Fodinibius salicampi TaxID=1920655 RepID=A0ABT3PZL6_9BACT|nr:hypothetical protein [Fodinibius salicampi]MCW9713309.1 hypothetical protein [Fodinibius salicampi]